MAVLAASPAFALPGLMAVRSTSVGQTPGGLFYAEALCPIGTRLAGGGGQASAGPVRLATAIADLGNDRLWSAAAVGNGNTSTSMTAIGICASGMSGYQTVLAEQIPPAGSLVAAATAVCPAGKRVIGGGGSNAGQPWSLLDGIWISPDLSMVYARTMRTPGAPPDSAPYVVAVAICIDPVPGQQRVMAATQDSIGTAKSVSVNCPSGTRLHGLGGMLGGSGGQIGLESLRPMPSRFGLPLGGATVTARVLAGSNYQGAWRAEVYGVCAN